MSRIGINKLLCIIIAGAFLAVFMFFFQLTYKAYRDRLLLEKQEVKLMDKVDLTKDMIEGQTKYVKRIKNDPVFFEWVARQRLGYGTGDEIIFRFEDNVAVKEYRQDEHISN